MPARLESLRMPQMQRHFLSNNMHPRFPETGHPLCRLLPCCQCHLCFHNKYPECPLWHLQLRILLFRFLLLLQRQPLLVLQHLLSALCMLHPSQLVLLLQPSSRFPVSFSFRLHPLSSVLSHRFHRMLLYSSHAGLQIF